MDCLPGLVVLALIGVGIGLIIQNDQPILTAVAGTFVVMCVFGLGTMIVIQMNTGWNDDMLAPYSFLQAMLLCGLGFRHLVERERSTRIR